MPDISITVTDKRPVCTAGTTVVCDNSDYIVHWDLDAEWSAYDAKTMRVIYMDSTYADIVFSGDSVALPPVPVPGCVQLGLYAGDIHTSRMAFLRALSSVRSASGAPANPTPDVYDQLMELIKGMGGSGLTATQIAALDGLFTVAAYTSDPTAAYKAFRIAFGLPVVTMYSITTNLTNAETSNSAASIAGGASYSATITAEDGYTISAVTVTMGGTDITSTAWDADAGVITIAQVTGDVVIAATARSDAGWTKDVPYDITWIEGKYITSNGVEQDSVNFACSDYLPCDGLQFAYMENVAILPDGAYALYYDENKTPFVNIGGSNFTSDKQPALVALVIGAKYFRVNRRITAAETVVTPKVLPVIDETTVPVAGREYAPVVLMGKTVWNNTGVEADTTTANNYCTGFCFCYGFATVTLNKKVRSIVNFYDAEKNYLSRVVLNTVVQTADIPEGAKYFRYDNGSYTRIWPSVVLQEATE